MNRSPTQPAPDPAIAPDRGAIALFGTSADPPTWGHQAILAWLGQHYAHVAVWAADNPFKTDQTPLHHRQAMLTALVQDLMQDLMQGMDPPVETVRVYPDLSHRYTIATVERARDRWPGRALALTVGSDLVEQLPQWYRATELLTQVSLVVVPRPGHAIAPTALDRLRQLGTTVTLADLEGLDVSSSAYRRKKDPATLPPAVVAYIRHHHLYPRPHAG